MEKVKKVLISIIIVLAVININVVSINAVEPLIIKVNDTTLNIKDGKYDYYVQTTYDAKEVFLSVETSYEVLSTTGIISLNQKETKKEILLKEGDTVVKYSVTIIKKDATAEDLKKEKTNKKRDIIDSLITTGIYLIVFIILEAIEKSIVFIVKKIIKKIKRS